MLAFAFFVSAQYTSAQVAPDNGGSSQSLSVPVSSAKVGLIVKLRLLDTLSSAHAKVGQPISLEVTDAVLFQGKVIISAGAKAHGSVTMARRRGRNRREGRVVFTVTTVGRSDGKEARLQAAAVQKGTGHGAGIFGPCTFPLPADPVGLFKRGENVVIPVGTELVATLVLDDLN